jgi:hypothetical protein
VPADNFSFDQYACPTILSIIPFQYPAGRRTLVLVGWLVLCFAASGTAIFVSTGGWYADLHKPSWNPPVGSLARFARCST